MHLVWHSVSPKRGRMIDLRDTDMPKYAGDNSTSPVQAPIPSSTRLGADQGPYLGCLYSGTQLTPTLGYLAIEGQVTRTRSEVALKPDLKSLVVSQRQ